MRHRTSGYVALVTLLAAALLIGLSPIGAQAPATGDDHTAHLKAWDAHKAMTQSSPYRSMNWSFVGPTNISGRIADVAVADRGSSRRLYAGSCCGGVWTSDDLGQTWQAVFDQEASSAVGALAVAPSNPDIVWVGTGESNIFRSSTVVRRSTGIPAGARRANGTVSAWWVSTTPSAVAWLGAVLVVMRLLLSGKGRRPGRLDRRVGCWR